MPRKPPPGFHDAVIPSTRAGIARALVEGHGVPCAVAQPVAAAIAADRYSEVELGWIYLLEGTLDTVPPAVVDRWIKKGTTRGRR